MVTIPTAANPAINTAPNIIKLIWMVLLVCGLGLGALALELDGPGVLAELELDDGPGVRDALDEEGPGVCGALVADGVGEAVA